NIPSKWIVHENSVTIDIGQVFAKSISWNKIRYLNYDHPVLSYIVDLTEPQEELCAILPPSIYYQIFRAPTEYYNDASAEFKMIFAKFFNDRNNWDKDTFGNVHKEDKKHSFYEFIRNVCRILFELWNTALSENYCLEGTWHHQVLDPIFKEITKNIAGCFWNWGEACSLASSFRKETYSRKPDLWLLQTINHTIQETLYEEASGSPFQPDQTKITSDNFKLFRLGRDSKYKMDVELIFNNLQYLRNGKNLLQQIHEIEVFLFQAYETRLRICIIDQPGSPFYRVRKVFDLMIPYKMVDDEVFILGDMQKAPIHPPGTSFDINISDYPTFPSP
ncbi:18721_t:CDS:2, partial [Racocetra persica]